MCIRNENSGPSSFSFSFLLLRSLTHAHTLTRTLYKANASSDVMVPPGESSIFGLCAPTDEVGTMDTLLPMEEERKRKRQRKEENGNMKKRTTCWKSRDGRVCVLWGQGCVNGEKSPHNTPDREGGISGKRKNRNNLNSRLFYKLDEKYSIRKIKIFPYIPKGKKKHHIFIYTNTHPPLLPTPGDSSLCPPPPSAGPPPACPSAPSCSQTCSRVCLSNGACRRRSNRTCI